MGKIIAFDRYAEKARPVLTRRGLVSGNVARSEVIIFQGVWHEQIDKRDDVVVTKGKTGRRTGPQAAR